MVIRKKNKLHLNKKRGEQQKTSKELIFLAEYSLEVTQNL